MDQDQPAKDFADGHGLLVAVSDAAVRESLGVKPEEVVVVGNEDAPGGCSEFEEGGVCGPGETDFHRCRHVDVTSAEASGQTG